MADPIDPSLTQIPGLSQYLAMKQYMINQAQQEQARGLHNEFIQRRAAIPPGSPPEAYTGLGLQYEENPTNILRYGMASEDRKAAIQQRADAVDKMFDYHIKSMQNNIDNTMLRIKDAEAARMLKDKWETEKNDLLRQKNDIMKELGVARTQAQNKPPSGYRFTADGGLEAIPGGPADTKLQGQFNQDTASLNESISNMDRLAREANELKEHPGLGRITGIPGALPNIPGQPGANAQAKLDTLRSQTAFGVLQNMRNNSKTGGALGQVSNIEEKMLQDNLAALSRSQSKEEYQKSLQKIIEYTEGAKERLRSAYNMKHSNKQPQGLPSASDIDAEIARRRAGGG